MDYDRSSYEQSCNEFDKFYGSMEHGSAAISFVDRIEKIMK